MYGIVIRALLIAEEANPEWVSVPLVGWAHSRAISKLVDAHTVTQVRNLAAFRRSGVPESEYTAIDSERVAGALYKAANVLRGGSGKGWTMVTALTGLSYYYFERLVWQRFGARIRAGEFDLVHRITPLSPTVPSLLAVRCAAAGVPFIVGPLNGGVPWPRGFDGARRKEREWLSYVRSAHKLLPGYSAMRRHAAAIICGSRDTLEQVPEHCRDKCVYIPENAVDPARFPRREPGEIASPLRVAFVGRLVPYKGADMLIDAAAPLLRSGRVVLDIIGDGPEMGRIKGMVEREGIGVGVNLAGWVEHKALHERLAKADVFAFPSIREFGGGVVLEAMALGLVPIVVGYGGPGELVTEETGFAVPIGGRERIVAEFRRILTKLAEEPEVIGPMQRQAQARVFELFIWGAKARQVLEVYKWVLGGRKPAEKPDWGIPLRSRSNIETEEVACQASAH